MFSETLLYSGWTLTADTLPDHLIPAPQTTGFILPGASALEDYSDLLGGEDESGEEAAQAEGGQVPGAPFTLPGMLPEDVRGEAALSREIDFGRLCGAHAELIIDHLCGSGAVVLNDETLLRFGSGSPSARIDLTDAMRLGRTQTLSIRFDDARGAGVLGAVILKTTGAARFKDVRITPAADGRTLCAAITLRAEAAGHYAVRAACVPDEEAASPWRKSHIHLPNPGESGLSLSFSLRAPAFESGRPYDAPALKLELYALADAKDTHGQLTDVRTLMTGRPGPVPRAYIPLTKEECRLDPDELIARAKAIGVPALFLPEPASDWLVRRCALEGVALLPYAPEGTALSEAAANSPCVSALKAPDAQAFSVPSPAQACARLFAMPAAQAAGDAGIPDDELLLDMAGRRIDPDAPETIQTLKQLGALSLRLRAEAARQGQYAGSLSGPGQWQDKAIFDAIRSAFAPLHLSVLPLRGAWWTQSHFSASLHAFIPEEERAGAYAVEAELLNAQGDVLASLSRDCPSRGGAVGIIEAQLPEEGCVLTLRTRLKRSGAVVESQELPVYVGLRGPLEAAFEE